MSALPAWLHALGWALVHVIWQAACVAGVVVLLVRTSRSPRARWLSAFVGLLVITGLALLTWRIEWLRITALRRELGLAGAGAWSLGSDASAWARAQAGIDQAVPIVLLVWAGGCGSMSVRLAAGWLGLRRLRASALALPDLEPVVHELSERLGVGRWFIGRISVAESARVHGPVVLGWLRPLILLPIGMATRMPIEQVEAALAHELAHVRRHDYLCNWVQEIIEALFFYHPAVRWLAALARVEREHDCDDRAIEQGCDRLDYARALVELEHWRGAALRAAPRPSLAIDGTPLVARVRRLLSDEPNQEQSMMDEARGIAVEGQGSRSWSRVSAWAPALLMGAVIGLAAALPGCFDELEPQDVSVEPSEAELSERASEGLVSPGIDAVELDVSWMPSAVQAHASTIEAAALRHGVDPDLLAIVVLLESGGDPRARSPRGARGLMQIMPSTGERIASERGLADHAEVRLDDPAYNLDFGAWTLARGLERWGSVELAAAAYNGGDRAVEAWLAGGAELSEETQRYKSMVAALWRERGDARSASLEDLRAQ